MRFPLTRRREVPGPFDALRRGIKTRETPGTTLTMDQLIANFWASLDGTPTGSRLVEQVWAADRCVQLNAQQIASMPMQFFGAYEPAWTSSPDPNWFPNGIGEAVFAAVWNYYVWGQAILYVTSRYQTGFPSGWTVLPSENVTVRTVNGRREFRYNEKPLPSEDVVQIIRNPTGRAVGRPALGSFGSHMLSAIASADLARTINEGGIPNAVLKSQRKLTKEQATAIQSQWMERVTARRGAPAVLPPELEFEKLAFSPADLMVVDVQQFDARVIAAAFGVPPFMLNVPLEGGLTYQNPAMLFEVWWRSELRPISKALASALTAQMLPRGSWVEFDAADLLEPEFPEAVAAWKTVVVDMGAATANEFRAKVLRLPPQPEAESIADELDAPTAATSGQQNAAAGNVQPLRPVTEVQA